MTVPKKFVLSLNLILLLSSCATLNITNESLIEQISKSNDQTKASSNSALFKYQSNNLDIIECFRKDGRKVKLEINRNTSLKIYAKNYKYKTIEVAFDTVVLEGNNLVGYESRITAIKHSIPIDNILRLQVLTIFPKYDN